MFLCSRQVLCLPRQIFGYRITVLSSPSCDMEHVLLMTGLGLTWALISRAWVESCGPSAAEKEFLTRKLHCPCVLLCVIMCVQMVFWELTIRNGKWSRSYYTPFYLILKKSEVYRTVQGKHYSRTMLLNYWVIFDKSQLWEVPDWVFLRSILKVLIKFLPKTH